jgi:outer membrane protein assembly factor BamD (BamD/ComL family)
VTKNLLLRTALLGCGVVLGGCASNQSIMNPSSRAAEVRMAMDGDPMPPAPEVKGMDAPPPPAKADDASGGFLDWLNPAHLFAAPKPPPPPVDSFIVRPDGLAPDKVPEENTTEARLAGARDLFRRAEYAKAQELYHAVANETKAQPTAVQEGLFFEAECLRLQGIYPRAADTYNELLSKFATTPYRDQAVQHMFDIANYWLEDTRKDMKDWEEYKENKRWFYWPRFANWDKSKPILDEEGRAVEKLEQVHLNDIGGPLADQALFYAGSVKMYNGDWRDADSYFSQIYEHHPNSPLAPKAVELAIMAKNLSTGGPEYDGRKAAEARKLVDAALRNYPELSNDPKKREYLERQLAGINLQQAAKDYEMAEFWKRTGHPGAAFFQFGIVKQRYPNTKFVALADQQMQELRGKLEKTGGAEPPPEPNSAPPYQVVPASLPAPSATPAPPPPPPHP